MSMSMSTRYRAGLALLVMAFGGLAAWTQAQANPDALARDFASPPDSARPWVYWFWLNGNITKEGITADLEAMRRVGIGGVLIMEVDQGAPVGPVPFLSDRWRELFKHVDVEARRLGLEVNMNDDAGWNGSGGPWIQPGQAMQQLTWTETEVTGPQPFDGPLPQPETVAGFYQDVAVQAFPATGDFRIPGIEAKAAFFQRRHAKKESKPQGSAAPGAQDIVARPAVLDLTSQMDGAGRLRWAVPAGKWTVIRMGHTCTGAQNAPAPASGRGLECDKLSKLGIQASFSGMMEKLAADTQSAGSRAVGGLVATHIDSWENGSQNWTPAMREEFRTRRGYDLVAYLPVFTGRVVDSLEISERFLWDLRRTVSELVIENYAGEFRRLANSRGLRFTVEAYGAPCDSLPYGGQGDEPMGEFWTPGGGAMISCRGMASAGHVYGKPIIGAEAFTSADQERWQEHPALLKAVGDQAFCEGINRFVFHRYALQPWLNYRPGMTMGPWGQHYERTQTWWEDSRPWHEYLARCQYLLRQGRFVADVCHVQAENSVASFGQYPRNGYDWDECAAEAVLTQMSVQDGRIFLPSGMSYRVLALSNARAMTPALARKLKGLVEAGATVLGPRPVKSPSLSGFPQCDEEVRQVAGELWGNCDGDQIKERSFGRGRIISGLAVESVLQRAGVAPDFACPLPWRFLHRTAGDAEIYFVANGKGFEATATCRFRVSGKAPELWWPETGKIEPAAVWEGSEGVTRVALTLGPSGSVFVVFRDPATGGSQLVAVNRGGKPLLSAAADATPKVMVSRARYGVLDDPARTRDVTRKVQANVEEEPRFPVAAMAQGDDPAPGVIKTLVVDFRAGEREFSVSAQDGEKIYLNPNAVKAKVDSARYGVLDDPKRTRDVRAKLQRLLDAGETSLAVTRMAEGDDPAFMVVKTLEVDATIDGKRVHLAGKDSETLDFAVLPSAPSPGVQAVCDAQGHPCIVASLAGDYELLLASGTSRRVQVGAVPPPLGIEGPWELDFAPGGGAPERVKLEQLVSWSAHEAPGVRYFSGSASYRKSFAWQAPGVAPGITPRQFLDLGKVAVMAAVKLNGRDLGLLWKPPFRVEVTGVLKPGPNDLEIRVVNLWINRMIGDESLPEDSERNANGTLKSWPEWVQQGTPSPAGRITFTTWRLWAKDAPLVESGLLGPVTIQTALEVQ